MFFLNDCDAKNWSFLQKGYIFKKKILGEDPAAHCSCLTSVWSYIRPRNVRIIFYTHKGKLIVINCGDHGHTRMDWSVTSGHVSQVSHALMGEYEAYDMKGSSTTKTKKSGYIVVVCAFQDVELEWRVEIWQMSVAAWPENCEWAHLQVTAPHSNVYR